MTTVPALYRAALVDHFAALSDEQLMQLSFSLADYRQADGSAAPVEVLEMAAVHCDGVVRFSEGRESDDAKANAVNYASYARDFRERITAIRARMEAA